MEVEDLPTLKDVVTVVDCPIGGNTIPVTSGVVSRMEVLPYVHGSTGSWSSDRCCFYTFC